MGFYDDLEVANPEGESIEGTAAYQGPDTQVRRASHGVNSWRHAVYHACFCFTGPSSRAVLVPGACRSGRRSSHRTRTTSAWTSRRWCLCRFGSWSRSPSCSGWRRSWSTLISSTAPQGPRTSMRGACAGLMRISSAFVIQAGVVHCQAAEPGHWHSESVRGGRLQCCAFHLWEMKLCNLCFMVCALWAVVNNRQAGSSIDSCTHKHMSPLLPLKCLPSPYCYLILRRLAWVLGFAMGPYGCMERTWKPFNPILGETFEMDLDKGVRFFAEQVLLMCKALAALLPCWLHIPVGCTWCYRTVHLLNSCQQPLHPRKCGVSTCLLGACPGVAPPADWCRA